MQCWFLGLVISACFLSYFRILQSHPNSEALVTSLRLLLESGHGFPPPKLGRQCQIRDLRTYCNQLLTTLTSFHLGPLRKFSQWLSPLLTTFLCFLTLAMLVNPFLYWINNLTNRTPKLMWNFPFNFTCFENRRDPGWCTRTNRRYSTTTRSDPSIGDIVLKQEHLSYFLRLD